MDRALLNRIQSFLPLEKQYQEALTKKNYGFFLDFVEGYLASIWCGDFPGILHFIDGARVYPLVITAIFFKKVEVFEWILDQNGGDLSFLRSIRYFKVLEEMFNLAKESKYLFSIIEELLSNSGTYYRIFSENDVQFTNRARFIGLIQEVIIKTGNFKAIIDELSGAAVRELATKKLKEMSEKEIRKTLNKIFQKRVKAEEGDHDSGDDSDSDSDHDSGDEDDGDDFLANEGKPGTTFEEDFEELIQESGEKIPILKKADAYLKAPYGKLKSKKGRFLRDVVSASSEGGRHISRNDSIDALLEELVDLKDLVIECEENGYAGELKGEIRDKIGEIKKLIPKVIEAIDSEYEKIAKRTKNYLLGGKRGFRIRRDFVYNDEEDCNYDLPFTINAPRMVIFPNACKDHPRAYSTFVLYSELFQLGYRLLKYKLTGVLDPEETTYNYETTEPLISRDREELLVCFDVRVNRKLHPDKFMFNTIIRYSHLLIREDVANDICVLKSWKNLGVNRPSAPSHRDVLQIYYETGIAYPFFPLEQFRDGFRYPIDFYQTLKGSPFFYPNTDYSTYGYGAFVIKGNRTDRLLTRIFTDVPADFLTKEEWKRIISRRKKKRSEADAFLTYSDFGFDNSKYSLVDSLELSSLFIPFITNEFDAIKALYNAWRFYKNNSESGIVKAFFSRNRYLSLHVKLYTERELSNWEASHVEEDSDRASSEEDDEEWSEESLSNEESDRSNDSESEEDSSSSDRTNDSESDNEESNSENEEDSFSSDQTSSEEDESSSSSEDSVRSRLHRTRL